jgi:hypothetical protein
MSALRTLARLFRFLRTAQSESLRRASGLSTNIPPPFIKVGRRFLKAADSIGIRRLLKRNGTALDDFQHDGKVISFLWPPIDPVTSASLADRSAISSYLENFRLPAFSSQSDCCAEGQAGRVVQRNVYFINGICTSLDQHTLALTAISECSCHRVLGIYNGTRGFLLDALDVVDELKLIQLAQLGRGEGAPIPSVSALMNIIIPELMSLGEAGDSGQIELWAHSEGGAHASLALIEVEKAFKATLTSEPLQRIQARTFGSVAPWWVDGPAYEHLSTEETSRPMSLE